MKKLILAALALAASAAATQASATTFVGDYAIHQIQSADAGLVLQTQDQPGGVSFSLNAVGDTAQVDLFKLFTTETSVDADDLAAKLIKVGFNIAGATGDDVTGLTKGNRILLGLVQNGSVNWGAGQLYSFGNGGLFRVTLNNGVFNQGAFGPKGGVDRAAMVTANFELVKAAAVPEPATWALMIGGFGLAGAALRRRRSAVIA